MTVLPADRRTRAAAVVGAAVMCLGVALFAHAYPHQWVGGPSPELTDLTLPTAGLYFLGAATALWSVFVGVANFKTRNDPGGTVTMEVTHKGETKIIEVERDRIGGMGGVGLLGGTPDGDVETQTNRTAPAESGAGRDGGTETGSGIGSGRHGGEAATDLSRGSASARGSGGTGASRSGPGRHERDDDGLAGRERRRRRAPPILRSPIDDAGTGGPAERTSRSARRPATLRHATDRETPTAGTARSSTTSAPIRGCSRTAATTTS